LSDVGEETLARLERSSTSWLLRIRRLRRTRCWAHATGHDYVLTDRGLTLWPAVFTLAQWGEQHLAPSEGPRRIFSHATCGTDLEPTGLCPECRSVPGPADLAVRQGPGANPTLRNDPVSAALRHPHRLLTPLPDTAAAESDARKAKR
jgi:hypothetical protein